MKDLATCLATLPCAMAHSRLVISLISKIFRFNQIYGSTLLRAWPKSAYRQFGSTLAPFKKFFWPLPGTPPMPFAAQRSVFCHSQLWWPNQPGGTAAQASFHTTADGTKSPNCRSESYLATKLPRTRSKFANIQRNGKGRLPKQWLNTSRNALWD